MPLTAEVETTVVGCGWQWCQSVAPIRPKLYQNDTDGKEKPVDGSGNTLKEK